MKTEEKAKAYDDALEQARKELKTCGSMDCDAARQIFRFFPQLRESEDEKIRKWLINYFNVVGKSLIHRDFTCGQILAWLEKQKYDRMKPVYDNQESFESALNKAWKSYNESGARTVDSCEDDYAEYAHAKGFREGYLFGFEKQKESLRDFIDNFPYSDEQKEQKPTLNWRTIEQATTKRTNEGDCVTTEKMLIKGLIDDEDYRIIDKDVMVNKNLLCIPVSELNAKEQKPAKEQFPPLKGLDAIKAEYYDKGFKNGFDEGVDSVKPAEWSEEDKQMLARIIERGQSQIQMFETGLLPEHINWLKSLRPQPKVEWSEEDKNTYKWVYNLFERSNDKWFECVFAGCYPKVKRESVLAWLKSLRPSWKPSEEQMDSLRDTIVQTKGYSYSVYLPELYEQLKKLM